MRIISKKEFDRIPDDYKGIYEDFLGHHPEWNGRRTAMLPGDGVTLSVEGVHFLVAGDYSHLPSVCKENAFVGGCYQISGGYIEVSRVYRVSEEEAFANDLYYLDRIEYVNHAPWGVVDGSCALFGSDIRSDYRLED